MNVEVIFLVLFSAYTGFAVLWWLWYMYWHPEEFRDHETQRMDYVYLV